MNGKQLKNSILQWAIQGKLVPQNPKDEPASKLLERITAAKNGDCASPECHSERSAKGTKSKNLAKKKSAPTSRIYREGSSWFEQVGSAEPNDITEEIPFDIPESWEWCRIEMLASVVRGGSPRPAGSLQFYEGPIPFMCVADITKDEGVYVHSASKSIKEAGLKKTRLVGANTLLLSNSGATLGVPKINTFETTFNDGIAVFLNLDDSLKLYLYWFFKSQTDSLRKINQGTAQPNLNTDIIRAMFIPIPPLAEQKRIVEKLEKILPLVDEYDSAQTELDKLNAALPETLKKSLLQEAIQGKLVPQNPKDEPASKLLERIVAFRNCDGAPACHPERSAAKPKDLAKKKKSVPTSRIYREGSSWYEQIGTAEPTDITDQIPFDIPETWEWCRLGNFISITTGLAYKKEDLDVKSEDSVRVLRGGNIDYGKWMKKDDDVIIASKFVNPDLFLKKGMFITPAVTSLEQMGKTALIESNQENIVVGGFVMMLSSCFNDESFLMYLLNFFQSYYYKQFCQSITNKSGQAFYNLSRQKLLQGLVPIPPLAEQKRIVAKLEQLLKAL